MNHLETLLVESSALANLAFGADVPLHVARRALKRLSDMTPGELRFIEKLYGLGPAAREALLDAVEPAPLPLVARAR